MGLREITLTLPDDLAEEAEASGLLTPGSLEQIIRDEIKRRKTDRLFDIMDRLAVADKGELTKADVAAEIHAYRAEKRADRAGGR
jgi:post-segregation antitoxin (ccd killing protein)